jgi:hypothetical protein
VDLEAVGTQLYCPRPGAREVAFWEIRPFKPSSGVAGRSPTLLLISVDGYSQDVSGQPPKLGEKLLAELDRSCHFPVTPFLHRNPWLWTEAMAPYTTPVPRRVRVASPGSVPTETSMMSSVSRRSSGILKPGAGVSLLIVYSGGV